MKPREKGWALIGRLAFRVEGSNWNAYFAKPDTMVDAIFLGSIKLRFIEENPTRKKEFMQLMRSCFADSVKQITGEYPMWQGEKAAPEHERSKE